MESDFFFSGSHSLTENFPRSTQRLASNMEEKISNKRKRNKDSDCLWHSESSEPESECKSIKTPKLMQPRPLSLYEKLPVEIRVMIMRKLGSWDVDRLEDAFASTLPELKVLAQLREKGVSHTWPTLYVDDDADFDPDILKGWYWMYPRQVWKFCGSRCIDDIAAVQHDIMFEMYEFDGPKVLLTNPVLPLV